MRFRHASLALLLAPALLGAQEGTVADSVAPSSIPAPIATAALVLAGAAGAQIIKTPKAWARTSEGFARRVGDQTGFYLAQTSLQRGLEHASGWRTDHTPCSVALLRCATGRVFVARTATGARKPHLPFVGSVVGATALSLAWRPERHNAVQFQQFVVTRLAIVFGGFIAERAFADWWSARK
ncbi:MAG: hypothetical protein ACO1Q7_21145 [Gemmatimonas sp.]